MLADARLEFRRPAAYVRDMARPQSPDFDERRRGMVDAAARLFAAKGFQGTAVADVAAACGAAKSLIYHYFPSKEDILYHVMEDHLDALVEAAQAALTATSPADRLRQLATTFMALYAGAAHRHTVLLNELDNLSAARRAEVIARQREIIAVVERIVADLPSTTQAPRVRAMLFLGMINWTHTWFRNDGPVSPEQVGAMAADLMIGDQAS